MFFPDKTEPHLANEAVVMCMSCPVFQECKDFKQKTGSRHGIWAGVLSKRGD